MPAGRPKKNTEPEVQPQHEEVPMMPSPEPAVQDKQGGAHVHPAAFEVKGAAEGGQYVQLQDHTTSFAITGCTIHGRRVYYMVQEDVAMMRDHGCVLVVLSDAQVVEVKNAQSVFIPNDDQNFYHLHQSDKDRLEKEWALATSEQRRQIKVRYASAVK